jgi:uncharacterized protein
VEITFDPAKRDWTLEVRGLDFLRCEEVFDGTETTQEDRRVSYGEQRWTTAGWLDGRMVIVVWTIRNGTRRIISLRKANEREQARFGGKLRAADVTR